MTAKDVVFAKDTKPILKAARAKEWNKAIEATDDVVGKLETPKDTAYERLHKDFGAARVGDVDDHLADALSKAKTLGDTDNVKSLKKGDDQQPRKPDGRTSPIAKEVIAPPMRQEAERAYR